MWAPESLDELIRAQRSWDWCEAVSRWMARAASGERPLKPLLIVGPHGTGKTTCVALAARKNGVELVDRGADDDDMATVECLRGWVRALGNRTFSPQVLFIDDADVVLDDEAVVERLLVAAQVSPTPLVMALSDAYVNAGARTLNRRAKGTTLHCVRVGSVPTQRIAELIRRRFCSIDNTTAYRLANDADGDVRRALHSAHFHSLGSASVASESSSLSCATIVYDKARALLGNRSAGRVPTDVGEALRVLAPSVDAASSLEELVFNAYPQPASNLETCARVAANFVDADLMRQAGVFDESCARMASALSLVGNSSHIRRARRKAAIDGDDRCPPFEVAFDPRHRAPKRELGELVAVGDALAVLARDPHIAAPPRETDKFKLLLGGEVALLQHVWRYRRDQSFVVVDKKRSSDDEKVDEVAKLKSLADLQRDASAALVAQCREHKRPLPWSSAPPLQQAPDKKRVRKALIAATGGKKAQTSLSLWLSS